MDSPRPLTPLEDVFSRFDALVDRLSIQANRSDAVADKICGKTPAEGGDVTPIDGEGIVSEIHSRLDLLSNIIKRITAANDRLTEL
jgi:hypothetical protein